MKFEEITETITITFDMGAMETLARFCRYAAENVDTEQQLASVYLAAFTAATMIARTHADIGEENVEHMARVRARLELSQPRRWRDDH